MAANGNGSAPTVKGRAYPIEDHTYDVVVVARRPEPPAPTTTTS